MKQFFVLGRNPVLSKAEILSYLEARGIKSRELIFEDNYLVLEYEDKDYILSIQELGGAIKAGKILFEAKNHRDLLRLLDEHENDVAPSEKFSYGLYGQNHDEEDVIKKSFKTQGKLAMLRHGRTSIKFENMEVASLPNAEFSFFMHRDTKIQDGIIHFGVVDQDYDYSEIKKRDMKKPERRESLAISPRLAKILINLSQAQPGQLLLDPFCGVGSILIEGIMKGINVYGIDKDKKAIESAKRNLKWIESEYDVDGTYKLFNEDSRNMPNLRIDAVATETPLTPSGDALRKKPSDKEAVQMMKGFESIIVPILKRISQIKKPGARIAITFPRVREHVPDIFSIKKQTGLKLYEPKNVNTYIHFPIKESRPDQYISRDIMVFV